MSNNIYGFKEEPHSILSFLSVVAVITCVITPWAVGWAVILDALFGTHFIIR